MDGLIECVTANYECWKCVLSVLDRRWNGAKQQVCPVRFLYRAWIGEWLSSCDALRREHSQPVEPDDKFNTPTYFSKLKY